jgi:fibronectin type 3 domain-containing protein
VAIVVAVVVVLAAVALLAPRPSAPSLDIPPSAPQNLGAAPGDGTVTLTWQAPKDRGSSAIKNYRVYRGTMAGGESYLTELGNVLTTIDKGLTNGQTYYYKVTAVNSMGEGPRSTEAAATPGGALSAPSEPRNLQSRAGNAQVSLTWDMPASTGSSPVTNYRVFRGPAAGQEAFLVELGSSTGYTSTGLVNGQTYFFTVSAKNAAGEGPRAAPVNATPTSGATVPSAPLGLTATPGTGNISLNWQAPADDGGSQITGYSVYRSTVSGGEMLLVPLENVTGYIDSNLLAGYKFYYQVSARNARGEGPRCAEVGSQPLSKPGAPGNLRALAGLGNVSLAWDAPASDGGSPILSYIIYRGSSPGGETFLVISDSSTAFVDRTVINGTHYFYTVSATNAQGEGPQSAEANATPQSSFDTPSTPRNLSAVPGNGSVALSWDSPLSEGGAPVSAYNLYRNGSLLTVLGVVQAYTDQGLANGIAYSYEVSASNSIGEGSRSPPVSVTPAILPDAPTGLTAIPSNRNVTLGWQAPGWDGGAPVTGYVIFRNSALLANTGTGLAYRDSTVDNGVSYAYRVAAVNRVGQGPFTAEVSATPEEKPVTFAVGGAGNDGGVDIGTDSQDDVYVTGYFSGTVNFDPAGSASLASVGDTDIFVAKYDFEGKYIWAFGIGGAGPDLVHALQVEPSGAVVIAGSFSGTADFDPGGGVAILTSNGDVDGFVARYSADGNYIWARSFGGSSSDSANDLGLDSAGNLYVTGSFCGTVSFDPSGSGHVSVSNQSTDAFVLSFDGNGAYRWHFAFGSVEQDAGTAIAVYSNGTFFVAGYFNDSVDFDPGAAVNVTNSSGYLDIFLALYSGAGDYVWAGAMGGGGNDTPAVGGITLDGPGSVYLTGSFEGVADFLPTNISANIAGNGGTDAFVAEYGPFGEYKWAFAVGGPLDDGGSGLVVDGMGNIYLTGYFRGTAAFDPTSVQPPITATGTGGAADVFLAKYSPGGLLTWVYGFGAAVSGTDKVSSGAAVCLDVGGNVLMTGSFYGGPVDFDPTAGTKILTSAGLADIFVARYDGDGKPA